MNYFNAVFYAIVMTIFTQAADRPVSVYASRSLSGGRLMGSSFMQQCAKEHGIEHYFSYFNELSRLPHVSDELKITRSMIMIPFFSALHSKTKEEQKKVFDDFTQEKFVLNYPLWRLFLAGLAHANIGDKGYILCTAIGNEDTALVRQLLEQGANVNSGKYGYSSLWYCRRPEEAKLLVDYGADIVAHHRQNDLIEPICAASDLCNDKEGIALMDFYLRSGIQLNEKNNFGYCWFRILLRNLHILDRRRYAVEAKLELLWQSASFSNKSISAVTKFLQKWDGYPIVRKLLHGGAVQRLQKRALTGQRFTKIQPVVMKCVLAKK